MTKGRPRKSMAELQRDGTFRADRHADRQNEGDWVTGSPVKPAGLSEYQSKVWEYVVGSLPDGSVGLIDTISLQSLMTLLEQAERCRKVVQSIDPSNVKDYGAALQNYRRCWKCAEKILSDFGVTPRNRTVIEHAGEKTEAFDVYEFLDSDNCSL